MVKKSAKTKSKTTSPKKVAVACAFCGNRVRYTDVDPISIGIVERWRPYEERPDWTVYAHRECFMSRLDRETRVELDESDALVAEIDEEFAK